MASISRTAQITSAAWTRRQWLAACAAAAGASALHAQTNYPSRRVEFVMPTGPGSSADTVSRYLAQRLTDQWRVPVVVSNKPGADSIIANTYALRQPADGYTLLVAGAPFFMSEVLNKDTMPYLPKDFVPVARITSTSMVFVVGKKSSSSSLKELLDSARQAPGQIDFAVDPSLGMGAVMELNRLAGVQLRPVPHKDYGTMVSDVVGGHIHGTVVAASLAAPHVRNGSLKALGTTTRKRSSMLPEVPTVAESGVPEYELTPFAGMMASAATPPVVLQKVSDAIHQLTSDAEFDRFALAQGVESYFASREEWARTIDVDRSKWIKLAEMVKSRQA